MASYQPHVPSDYLNAEPLADASEDQQEVQRAYLDYQGLIGFMVMGKEQQVTERVKVVARLFSEGAYPEDIELVEAMDRLRECQYEPVSSSVEAVSIYDGGQEEESRYVCSSCSAQGFEPQQQTSSRAISLESSEAVGEMCLGCGMTFGGVVLNPKSEMVHQRLEIGGWEIDIWQRSKSPDSVSQDQALACSSPGGGVRIAVVDGVTPHQKTPGQGRVNGAVFAATVIRQQLKEGGDLAQSMQKANKALHSSFVKDGLISRALPQATAAGVDIAPDGSITVAHAGTDSVIVRQGGQLKEVFGGDPVDPQAIQKVAEAKKANPDMSPDQKLELEEKYWSQDQWKSTSIGRFENATIQQASIQEEPDEIILASDGAWLNDISRAESVDAWVDSGLRDFESAQQTHGADKKYDDITIIRARRKGSR